MPFNTAEIEPLLAGTLALMSAFQNGGPCPHMSGKIVSNLDRLAAHPLLSPEFRTVLGRLAAQWQQGRTDTAPAALPEPPQDAVAQRGTVLH